MRVLSRSPARKACKCVEHCRVPVRWGQRRHARYARIAHGDVGAAAAASSCICATIGHSTSSARIVQKYSLTCPILPSRIVNTMQYWLQYGLPSQVTALPSNSTTTRASSAVTDLICGRNPRSEEHTSELQSLMRISYAVFCLKKKKNTRLRPIQQ